MLAGMDEELDVYTIEQAAEALGMSVGGIRLRIKRGDMIAQRIGARVLAIPGHEVRRWQEQGKLKPGPKRKASE